MIIITSINEIDVGCDTFDLCFKPCFPAFLSIPCASKTGELPLCSISNDIVSWIFPVCKAHIVLPEVISEA